MQIQGLCYFGTMAYAFRLQELPYRRRATNLQPCSVSEVPSMTTLILSIFVVLIIGAASAFAYVVYSAEDSTGP
jgi:hypothetical protein